MESFKQHALALAKRGIPVFTCRPGDKPPCNKGWQREATTNAAEIEALWDANPQANIGCLMGEGLLAVDIDRKNGVNGMQVIDQLVREGNILPQTFTVETITGGFHCYFLAPATRNTVGHLGEGVDTRGKGGYLVGPGSSIKGKVYEIVHDMAPVQAPEWLLEEIGKAPTKHKDRDKPFITVLNTDAANRAAQLLVLNAPETHEGQRNNIAYKLACEFRDFGLALDGIDHWLNLWNYSRCLPPLDDSDIETIVRSAWNNAQNPSGFTNPETQFKPIEQKENALQVLWPSAEDLINVPKRQWIIEGRLMIGFLSLIAAPGGVGKSMLAMLEALSVATGRPLLGKEPERTGKVLIYNTEDPVDEILRRLTALCLLHDIPLKEIEKNVAIKSGHDRPLILVRDISGNGAVIQADAGRLRDLIKKENFMLITLDPFVRTHRVNENDNNSIDVVTTSLSSIATQCRCAISLIHHTRKRGKSESISGEADFVRGASALVNATRITSTLTDMTPKEAERFGIAPGQHGFYMRFDLAKGNMSPPGEYADWYRKVSVTLANGDKVGAIEKVDLRPLILQEQETQEREKLLLAMNIVDFVTEKGGEPQPVNACSEAMLEYYPYLYEGTRTTFSRNLKSCFKEDGFVLHDRGLVVRYFIKSGGVKHWIKVLNYEEEIDA